MVCVTWTATTTGLILMMENAVTQKSLMSRRLALILTLHTGKTFLGIYVQLRTDCDVLI